MLSKFISTVGFIGYMPFAPGTFGTLAGLVFMVVFKPSFPAHLALTVFFIIIGIIASWHFEKLSGEKDPKHIVIDEFAGYLVSLLYLPMNWKYMIAAFILFRVFDIIKPPPIKKMETMFKGGFGVMADDIGAAIYTNLLLQAWRFLSY